MRAIYLCPLLLLALPACGVNAPPELAGESVGQYMVQATLTENGCGTGHPAPPALGFYVELRHLEGSTRGYWKLPDGPQVDGALTRNGTFRFTQAEEIVGLPPEPDFGYVGCNIARTEIVQGTLTSIEVLVDVGDADTPDAADALDAGLPDAGEATVEEEEEGAFMGTTTLRIDPLPGGDCLPLTALYGGAFPTLPCTIEYDLNAERLAEPLF